MRRGLAATAVILLFFARAAIARGDDGGTDGATVVVDAGCPAPDDAGACPTDLVVTDGGGCAVSPVAGDGAGAVLVLVAMALYASFAFRNSRSL